MHVVTEFATRAAVLLNLTFLLPVLVLLPSRNARLLRSE